MKTRLNQALKAGILPLFVVSLFLLSSCLKSNENLQTPEEFLDQVLNNVDKTKLAADLAVIDDSLERWDLTPEILIEPKGVRYKIDTLGDAGGAKPVLSNIIKIKYTGKFLSTGETFDSSDSLATKYLESFGYGLIVGIQTTLPLLTKGTTATLYIPSGYGYGATDLKNTNGDIIIPKNSNLIFQIKLLDVR